MLAPEEPMFVRHFLLDERLRANHTLGSRGYFFLMDTDGSRRSRVLSDQQILYNNVGTFSPGLRYILNVFLLLTLFK